MYHISDEYRIANRRARYHYNRARLLGLIPVGVAVAFLYFVGGYYAPLLYGALGCAVALHIMLWCAYEAHFGGNHTARTRRWLERSDFWYPGFLIVCQNGFFSVTLLVFWFIVCRLGFQAGLLDHALLAAWVLVWPILRVLRMRHHQTPEDGHLETAYEFFRYLHLCLISFLAAGLFTHMLAPDEVYSSDQNSGASLLGIAIWMPAALITVGCIVLFADHLVRKRPDRAKKSEADVL